ncbi:mating-type protein beta, variant 2 [Coprinopsis cinerea AmutBmut pab1-1]|nr:mating-type protein beta, variant 2 [Coprinopsis cinerea AmutBmut pab1-1]
MTFDLPEELQPFLDDITLSLSVVANSPSRVQKAAVNLQGVYRQHYNNVCRKYLQANTRTLQSQPETHTQRLNAIRRRYETEFQQRLSRMQGQYLATSQREQRSLPKRTPFNAEYTPLLEKYFEYNAFPPLRDREWLARKSMMTPRQIEVWFQNHRRRARNEGRRLERIPMDRIPVEISLDSLEETMAPFLAPKSKRSPSVHRRLTPPINSSHPRPEQMSASTSITTVLDAVSPPSYAFPTKFCPSSQNRDQTFPCKPSDFGLCAEGRTGKPTSKLRKKTCSMAAICDSLLVTRIAGPPIETESESPWHASRCIGHIVAPHPALVQTPAPSASQPSPASATTTHAHCRSPTNAIVRFGVQRAVALSPLSTVSTMPLSRVAGDSVDATLNQTLNCLPNDLLASLRGDAASKSTLASAISKVDALIQSCQQLGEGTRDLISSYASLVAFLPSGIRQAEAESSAVLDDFSNDVAGLFDGLALETDASPKPAEPAYIEPSCRWLKDNWYNPYPSPQVRSSIAKQTGASRKDIDAWFIDARKRIGWNELRRRCFDNKRANIVEAATRFHQGKSLEDLPCIAQYGPTIENDLASITSQASAWYDGRYAQSKLADKLDPVVKDMTPALKEKIKRDADERRREERQKKKRKRNPYPSPECSPASSSGAALSPVVPVIDLTGESQCSRPNLKRRASSCSVEEYSCRKRPRGDSSHHDQSKSNPETCLPSPATSAQEDLSEAKAASIPTLQLDDSTLEPIPASGSNKRKRCLSDGFQYPTAKRHQVRPQVVSDPFPLVTSQEWDDWLLQHMSEDLTLPGTIPPPVSVEAPDSNTPLDIQIFNFPPVPDLPAPGSSDSVAEAIPSFPLSAAPPACNGVPLQNVLEWQTCAYAQPVNTYNPVLQFDLPPSTDIQPSSATIPPMLSSSSFDPDTFATDPQFFDLFSVPISAASFDLPAFTPQEDTDPETPLTEAEKEAKKRELEELEAKVQAIRAQIARS